MSDYDREKGLTWLDADAPFPPVTCHYYVLSQAGAIIIQEVDAAEYYAYRAERPDAPRLYHERGNLVAKCFASKTLTAIDWAAVKRAINWMSKRGAKQGFA